MTEQLRTIQRSKANHEELMALVAKLQHRPKPGHPVSVSQLLTVPYPLPPGHALSASGSPRQRHQRPSSATPSAGGRGGGGSSRGNLAELREVPTCLPADGTSEGSHGFSTSEQILVRNLPADAEPAEASLGASGSSRGRLGGRVLVPPSSHTPSLSARASATAHAIIANQRPASARASSTAGGGAGGGGGQHAQIANFGQKTERLERSLGGSARARAAGEGSAVVGASDFPEPVRPDMS